MSSIVVYESVYGHTKQYADWIAQALGCDLQRVHDVSAAELGTYDTILFGGPLYVGKIKGFKQLAKHKDALAKKRVILFTAGMTPPEKTEAYAEILAQALTDSGITVERAFHFPGEVDPSKLKFVHGLIFKMVRKMSSSGKAPEDMDFSMEEGRLQRESIEPLVGFMQTDS